MSTFKTIPVSDTTYTLFKQRDGAGVEHDKWQRFESEPSDEELDAVIERHYSELQIADGLATGHRYREWTNGGKTRWRLCCDGLDFRRLEQLIRRVEFYQHNRSSDVEEEVFNEARRELTTMMGGDTSWL